jgi:endonuclease/exonuclease/phosphatase family metal-dependent hydrolase
MKTLRVATLNIWNRFGPWEERLVAIRAGVRALSPDLLGLQEVLRLREGEGDGLDQAAAIAAGFGYHVAYGASEGERWGNAALSRWPIVHTQVLDLPRVGTEDKRTVLFAQVESQAGTIPFFVTHLNWKFDEGHVREAQVRAIVQYIDSLAADRAFPAILVGDFNAEPDADEIRFLRGLTSLGGPRRVYFRDAFAIAGGGSPGKTYCRSNAFAAPLREPDRRIDYIFVRGDGDRFRGEPIDARVGFDEAVDGVLPSDHFGVVATLRAE